MLQDIYWLGPAGWSRLGTFLVLVPYLAIRSHAKMQATAGRAPLNRLAHFRSTMVMLVLFGALSLVTANRQDINLFDRPLAASPWAFAGGIAMYVAAIAVMRPRWRRAVEQRSRIVHLFMPSNNTERAWWILVSVLAGVSEEITWRGVQPVLLAFLLGSAWAGAVVAALSFGLAHIIQGWRAALIITGFALAFQGLVWLSGSLYVAMIVHVVYDITAGLNYGKLGRELGYRLEEATSASPAAPGEV